MHHVAVGVAEDLNLDVPGRFQVFLQEDSVIAESRRSLASGTLDGLVQLTPISKGWCTDLGVELTSINIDSAGGVFTGDAAQNLGGSFDNDADDNLFKATFGSSFGLLPFGPVAQPGLSRQLVAADGSELGVFDWLIVTAPAAQAAALLPESLQRADGGLCAAFREIREE